MRRLFLLMIFIFLPLTSRPARVMAIGLHIRGTDTFSEKYRIENVESSSIRSCSVWLNELKERSPGAGSSELDLRVEKAISKSNSLFRDRRHWQDEEFLLSRFAIAKKFAHRSHMSLVVDNEKGEVVGGIAMTIARYKKENRPDVTKPAVESAASSELLPEEESLGIVPLERPIGPSGQGLILEFRTFFIEKDFRKDIRVALLGRILEMSYEAITEELHAYHDVKKDTEFLWTQPVIKLYNDEPGNILYKDFGFTPVSENGQTLPVKKYDTNWWTLNVSPENLEKALAALALKNARQFLVRDIGEPTKFEVFKGHFIKVRSKSDLIVDRIKSDYTFTPEESYDLGHNLIGAPGARIVIKDNEPSYIGFLGREATIDGQRLYAGAEIWFKPGLKIERVNYPYRIGEDFHQYFRFPKELRHKIGSTFEANLSHTSTVESTDSTASELHVANTAVVIPVGSWMRWHTHSLALRAVRNDTQDWSPLPGLWVKKHGFLTFDIEEKGERTIRVTGMSRPFEISPLLKTIPDEEFSFWLGPNNEVIWAQMFIDNDTVIGGHCYKRGTRLTRATPNSPITAWDYWVNHYSNYQNRDFRTPRLP